MMVKYKLLVFSTVFIFTQIYSHLNAQSIDLLWTFSSGSAIRGGFSKDAKYLYFGNGDGLLYSINAETTSVHWIFKAQGAINSKPALTEKTVIITGRDNYVYALDKDTGKLVWKFEMQPATSHYLGWDYFIASPLVNSKITYIGSADHHLYALNTDSGELLWAFKTGDKIRATPKLYHDQLYVPSFDGIVYVLDASTGKLCWKFETDGAFLKSEDFGWDRRSINTTPSFQDSLMVFGSRDGSVYCVNVFSHKLTWKFSYGPTWAIAAPTIVNNMVMVGWSDNALFCAIDLFTGKEKWKFDCGSFIYSSPISFDGNVCFGVGNGKILLLDHHDGRLIWEYHASAPMLSTPILEENKIFIGDDDGTVYCLTQSSERRAVYHPRNFTTPFIERGLSIDPGIAPYFTSRGFTPLDSASLLNFIANCIDNSEPAVLVLGHDYLPSSVLGNNPKESLLRKFMEAGGKIISPGLFPGMMKADSAGNPGSVDYNYSSSLLDIVIDTPLESGNYSARATEPGLKMGLPANLNATNAMVTFDDLEVLATNEIGRPAIWMKKIGTKGGGYIACRTWSYLTSAREKDLEVLWKLCRARN